MGVGKCDLLEVTGTGRDAGCNRASSPSASNSESTQRELALLLEEIRVDAPTLLLADAVHALGDSASPYSYGSIGWRSLEAVHWRSSIRRIGSALFRARLAGDEVEVDVGLDQPHDHVRDLVQIGRELEPARRRLLVQQPLVPADEPR